MYSIIRVKFGDFGREMNKNEFILGKMRYEF